MKGAKGTCCVCSHPQAAALSAQLRAGASLRGIAREYGLGIASVVRHRSEGHLARKSAPPAPAALDMKLPAELPDGPAAKMLKELQALHLGALRRYAEALQSGTLRDVSQLATVLRKNLELRGRLEAQLAPPVPLDADERLVANPAFGRMANFLGDAFLKHSCGTCHDLLIAVLEELAKVPGGADGSTLDLDRLPRHPDSRAAGIKHGGYVAPKLLPPDPAKRPA